MLRNLISSYVLHFESDSNKRRNGVFSWLLTYMRTSKYDDCTYWLLGEPLLPFGQLFPISNYYMQSNYGLFTDTTQECVYSR